MSSRKHERDVLRRKGKQGGVGNYMKLVWDNLIFEVIKIYCVGNVKFEHGGNEDHR